MLTMCPKSCDNCGPCENNDENCENWKDEGFCSTRPDYMFRHCKVSCKVCIPGRNISTPCTPTFLYIYFNLYFFAVHYTVIISSCSSHSIGAFILFQSAWTNITAAMLGQHMVSANVSRGTWPRTAQKRAILAAIL